MRQLKISKSITNRSSEALDKYLVEIGREPMVSIDEEIELAQKIRKGGREGERAKEKLVKANLRFVVSVAKQYQHQGLGLTDLIDEGNIGLVKAAEKFDETRGFKFISYAVWWIRQSILQAIAEQSRIVRLPLNQVGALSKISAEISKFEQNMGLSGGGAAAGVLQKAAEGIGQGHLPVRQAEAVAVHLVPGQGHDLLGLEAQLPRQP